MGKRNNHTDASDGSLSDAMSEHELEELEVQVASSPTRTPTPANRKKTPNKEGRKSVGTMVGESDDESVHMGEEEKHSVKTIRSLLIPTKLRARAAVWRSMMER
jgi:hypothetical protein